MMKRTSMWFSYFTIGLAAWHVVNGLLHDIFILRKHIGPYNRDLLRLLTDGHVLLTCGSVYAVAYFLNRNGDPAGLYLCLVAAISMLVYCLMIFPFLKSFGTLGLNAAMLAITLVKLFSLR